jgi:hypothetical protein
MKIPRIRRYRGTGIEQNHFISVEDTRVDDLQKEIETLRNQLQGKKDYDAEIQDLKNIIDGNN